MDFFQLQRFPSHEVTIGDRPLGGQQPIRLQSMTNTNTLDIKSTVQQTIRIIEAGADYVRISAPNIAAAEALKEIRAGVKKAGFTNPLIADIHFNADVALRAARYVSKVRINPGNYTGSQGAGKIDFSPLETEQEKERIFNRLKPLVEVCKENGTAIRIGTNLGSLSPRIISQYGNTATGMVNATFEFLEIFRDLGFNDLVISLKASKPVIMVEAYEGMVEKMLLNNMTYPLHIGITEAGEGENGRIKSALGICSLLNKGIGDTIRVSLTEEPEFEIPFASKLSSIYQLPFTRPVKNYGFILNRSNYDIEPVTFNHSKLKAIVISDVLPATEDQWNTDASLPIAVKPKREADYYFTRDSLIPSRWPGKNFILPYEPGNTPVPDNVTVMVELKEEIYSQLNDHTLHFLRICCNDYSDPLNLTLKPGCLGIVMDMNSCFEEVDIKQWVEFSHNKRVPLIIRKNFQTTDSNELISHMATFCSNLLLERRIQGIWIKAPAINDDVLDISFGFIQSAGLRITRTEFISCPTCARTSYDLLSVLKDVQKYTSNLPGLKIAVMGCIVNGPGEMADADFGFVGTGSGKLHLYKGKTTLRKNIEPSEASQALLQTLREYGYIEKDQTIS